MCVSLLVPVCPQISCFNCCQRTTITAVYSGLAFICGLHTIHTKCTNVCQRGRPVQFWQRPGCLYTVMRLGEDCQVSFRDKKTNTHSYLVMYAFVHLFSFMIYTYILFHEFLYLKLYLDSRLCLQSPGLIVSSVRILLERTGSFSSILKQPTRDFLYCPRGRVTGESLSRHLSRVLTGDTPCLSAPCTEGIYGCEVSILN